MKNVFVISIVIAIIGLCIAGCEQPAENPESAVNSYPVTLSKATDTWTKLKPVPFVGFFGVEGMSVASIGNKIYAGFGYDAGDKATMRIYDIASNTWTYGASGPGGSSEGVGLAHGGLYYNIGGRGPASNANWAYDPVTDTWNTGLAQMPTARMGLAAAVVGNSIYAIGGRLGGAPNGFGKMDVVERYDIDKDVWTTAAPLLSPRSDLAAVTVGGKIYVFGGFDALNQVVNTVEVYDPVTDTWSGGLKAMPTARGAMYAVGMSGGTVYVIGGWDGVYPFNTVVGSTVEAYKVAQDTWTKGFAPMPTARSESGAAEQGGRIYILGGATPGGGLSVAAHEVYKP